VLIVPDRNHDRSVLWLGCPLERKHSLLAPAVTITGVMIVLCCLSVFLLSGLTAPLNIFLHVFLTTVNFHLVVLSGLLHVTIRTQLSGMLYAPSWFSWSWSAANGLHSAYWSFPQIWEGLDTSHHINAWL